MLTKCGAGKRVFIYSNLNDMKTLLSIALLMLALPAFPQDIVFDHPMELGRSLKDRRACYPVVDTQTGNAYLIVYNHKSITTMSLKADFSFLSDRVDERPDDTQEILGHAVDGTHLIVFFNTTSSSKITRLKLSLTGNGTETDRIEVGASNERYLNSFSIDNKFMVLQSIKNTNDLVLHSFAADGTLASTKYDLSAYKFSLEEGDDLATILKQSRPEYIEAKIPNPLEVASSKAKIFKNDSALVLTVDNEKYRTSLISLPLTHGKASAKFINDGFIDCDQSLTYSSNSYIYQNLLYQFKVCQTAMTVTISELASGKVVKTFAVQREGEINFKNTEIIQEGSETDADAKRELSKTKQFLRKCSYSNAAISVFPQRDEIVMVVGSFKEISRGGPGMMGMSAPGTTMSTPGGTVTMPSSYNPVYVGYGAYKFTKAVYFKSKLKPATLEHSPGLVFDDAFRRIKKYSEVHLQEKNYMSAGDITSVPLIAETLFKKGDWYYLGYYDKEKKQYTLREFR